MTEINFQAVRGGADFQILGVVRSIVDPHLPVDVLGGGPTIIVTSSNKWHVSKWNTEEELLTPVRVHVEGIDIHVYVRPFEEEYCGYQIRIEDILSRAMLVQKIRKIIQKTKRPQDNTYNTLRHSVDSALASCREFKNSWDAAGILLPILGAGGRGGQPVGGGGGPPDNGVRGAPPDTDGLQGDGGQGGGGGGPPDNDGSPGGGQSSGGGGGPPDNDVRGAPPDNDGSPGGGQSGGGGGGPPDNDVGARRRKVEPDADQKKSSKRTKTK